MDENISLRNKIRQMETTHASEKCSYQSELKTLKSTNREQRDRAESGKSRFQVLQKECEDAKLENAKFKETLGIRQDEITSLIRINNKAMTENNQGEKHLLECRRENKELAAYNEELRRREIKLKEEICNLKSSIKFNEVVTGDNGNGWYQTMHKFGDLQS